MFNKKALFTLFLVLFAKQMHGAATKEAAAQIKITAQNKEISLGTKSIRCNPHF